MIDYLEQIPYLFWFVLGLIVLIVLLISERKNNPKPTYAELEERLKKLEREKAELLKNSYSESKSDSRQLARGKNDGIIDTAAKLYILKFKFAIIGPLLAFIFGLIISLIDKFRLQ